MATELSLRVGSRIRQRRQELGLMQRQVAERMASTAASYQHISDWERGVSKPSDRYLPELADALETSPAFFFEEQETPEVIKRLGQTDGIHRLRHEIGAVRSHLGGEIGATRDEIGALRQILHSQQVLLERQQKIMERLVKEVQKPPPRRRKPTQ
jgi:transcriptional regulator with XRE-family HTH domain